MANMWSKAAEMTKWLVDVPPKPTAPDLALFQVDVLEPEGMREIDPLLAMHAIVRLAAPWTAPVAIGTLATLTPTDGGQHAVDLSWDVYAAILDAVGAEPSAEARADHVDEAREWASAALEFLPRAQLAQWRGEDRARRTMVADRLARSFLVPAAVAQKIAGAPPPARTLWKGQDAARLDAAKRAAAEDAAAEKAAALKLAGIGPIEKPRLPTWCELRAEGVRVDRQRLGVVTSEPFLGAVRTTEDEESLTYAWLALPGLALPRFGEGGMSSLDPDAVAPIRPADALTMPRALTAGDIAAPSPACVTFIRTIRARCMTIDTGPIDRARFGDRGLASARELAAEHAPEFLKPVIPTNPGSAYMQGLLMECLVRGCLVRPDVATALVLEVLDELHAGRNPPTMVPTAAAPREGALAGTGFARPELASRALPSFAESERPSRTMLEGVGALAANAAARGEVNPGELLEPALVPATKPKKAKP